jgi:hypothetical protein
MPDTKVSLFPASGLAPLASIPNTYQPPFAGSVLTSIAAKLAQTVSVLDFAANGVSGAPCDPTGVLDSTGGIAAAVAALGIAGGTVIMPPGTYKGSITLAPNVRFSCYGATLNYTGSGNAIDCPTSGALLYPGIGGLTINGGSTAAILMNLRSSFAGRFRDITFISNSLTNTCLNLTTNSTGTVSPDGTINTVNNLFENLIQVSSPGGNGCGTFIALTGLTSPATFVTDNTFHNCQAQDVNVVGINFVQWCDSNVFTGMTRIALNGAISPANGSAVVFASGAGGGVYSETFEHLAVDTFAIPATDNRHGLVCTNLLSTKNIHVFVMEFGPQVETQVTNIAANAIQSGLINIAPRSSSNFESVNMPGTNLGVGLNALTNIGLLVGNNLQVSGPQQYTAFAQNSVANFGSPTLGVCYGCTPGGVSSASPYTVSQSMGYYVAPGSNGTNATITNGYGFYCSDTAYGTSNFAFYSNMAAGVGKFAFYGAGTANSVLGGNLSLLNTTSVPAGGTAGAGLNLSSTTNLGVYFGSGAPTLSAAQGSLYLRTDGASNVTRMYVNNSSGSGTTWTAVNTVA